MAIEWERECIVCGRKFKAKHKQTICSEKCKKERKRLCNHKNYKQHIEAYNYALQMQYINDLYNLLSDGTVDPEQAIQNVMNRYKITLR